MIPRDTVCARFTRLWLWQTYSAQYNSHPPPPQPRLKKKPLMQSHPARHCAYIAAGASQRGESHVLRVAACECFCWRVGFPCGLFPPVWCFPPRCLGAAPLRFFCRASRLAFLLSLSEMCSVFPGVPAPGRPPGLRQLCNIESLHLPSSRSSATDEARRSKHPGDLVDTPKTASSIFTETKKQSPNTGARADNTLHK